MKRIIAIDGPAASGKSSVARRLSERIGFFWISSGGLYRTITRGGIESAGPTADTAEFVRISESLFAEVGTAGEREITFSIRGLRSRIHLTAPAVNQTVSRVAQIAEVREAVNHHLRRLAADYDLIVEGRDIGSIVFPDSPFKFYIDATPEERARRRHAQGLADEIRRRDQADSARRLAPLKVPAGATVIDSTRLTLEETVSHVVEHLPAEWIAATPAPPPDVTS